MMKNIAVEITKEKVAVVTIHCADSKVNKVSSALLDEIEGMLKTIDAKDIAGLVIVSGKEDNFVVGADVDEVVAMKTDKEIREYITKANRILNAIDALPVPVVCCIHGNCLGGGLEVALASDHRIAADSTNTVMGLPEVMLGLLPAGGGTQRLPRLVGLRQALPMMLAGKNVRIRKARKLGLIDEIVVPYGLKEIGVKKALELARKGFKRKRKRSLVDAFLESFLGRKIVFKQARQMVMRQTRGLYPAPLEIIDSVEYGYKKGIVKGLEADIDRFVRLVMTPQAKSLMNLFFGITDLKKNPYKNKARNVNKLAVIGTGLMGSGIAAVSTAVCDTILMKDMSLDAAARGISEVGRGISKQVKSGSVRKFDGDVMYGKLVPCDDYSRFAGTDIVIEAVFEDIHLKRKILEDVEESTDKNTIFASNTSALPIKSIAQGCKRPENVIGMHYFSPVPRMPLLEIITTSKTAAWVTATALELGISQGKTCIIVRDGPGFYTTRILAPLLLESSWVVAEGAEFPDVDRAMQAFGYPVGPITLLDEVGIDVGIHVIQEVKPIFEPRGITAPMDFGVLSEKGFLGRKSKKGLYRYDLPKKKGKKPVNEEVYALFGNRPRTKINVEEVQHRISLMMVNEAVTCLQEGIVASPRDGDLGAILGLGFPPFRGGPFRYVDSVGAGNIVGIMEGLAAKYGKKFTPASMLKDMAKKGAKFYK
ncbi:MAG: enoyl-CoA hydratase/isomerase family protein [Spirochaetes bacterium]|nr:enoyl-CoA hydratase/isomerase family protein [Spirochaetota bacterium]